MNEAVLTFDAAGRITGVDPAFCRLTGYDPAELIDTLPPYPFWPDAGGAASAFSGVDAREQPLMFSCKDGTRLPIEVVAASTAAVRMPGVAVVRCPQKQQEAEARIQLALEAGLMGIWEWQPATEKLVCSAGLEVLHGVSADTAGSGLTRLLARLDPADREALLGLVDKAIHDGGRFSIDYQVTQPDGSVHWIGARGRGFVHEQGRPDRVLCVCADMTEHMQRLAEKNELLANAQARRAELEQASRTKDEFLAVLSHELRVPLAPVLTATQMMEQDPTLPEDHRVTVTMIRRNVELQARLLDDLLDLVRICRGKLELFQTNLDVHDKIHGVVAMIHEDIRARKLTLGLELNAMLSRVRGDGTRLQQVLWNLLKNAIKFTEPGGMIGVRTHNDDEGRICIEVWDTGCGIEPHLQGQIFEAFVQGGRSITRRYGGLGLGLSISRALVTMHGGELTASSEGRGKGATFTAKLPVSMEGGSLPTEENGAQGPGAGAGRRILLVEDHGDTRRIMKRLLERGGYTVETADGFTDALEVASNGNFDLMICDIGLPDGNGLDLMKQLRARSPLKGIAISGYGMEDDVRRSKEVGFIEHLTKPVDLRRLERAVRESFT